MSELNNDIIAVVGLGYVGLPLAVEFGKQFRTIGFDLSEDKIVKYKESIDPMGRSKRNSFKTLNCCLLLIWKNISQKLT